MRFLAFCSSGLFIVTALLGFFYEMPLWCIQLALCSVVHSVGLYLLQIFVAQAAQKEVNMSQFNKSNGDCNYRIRLTMYYFQLYSHRIGQVGKEEVAMLL